MLWIIFAWAQIEAMDAGLISAMVGFGASGAAIAIAYLLTTSQRVERKEAAEAAVAERKTIADALALDRAENREFIQRLQEQVIQVAKDKGSVIEKNTDMMMGLKIEMTKLIARLGHTGAATAELTQAVKEISVPKNGGGSA